MSEPVSPDRTQDTELPAWRQFVQLATCVSVEHVREQWRARGADGPHGMIDAILTAPPTPASALSRREALAGARALLDSDPLIAHLSAAFELAPLDRELLALVAGAHIDPRLSVALGYVEDDPQPRAPSIAAAAELFGWELGARPGPATPLVRWSLAAPSEPEPWQPEAPWTLDPDIAAFLCGRADWHRFWPGLRLDPEPARDCLRPALLEQLTEAVRSLSEIADGRPLMLELVGRPGSGRRTLLQQLCTKLGRRALVIECPALGIRALRTARLLGAVPIWLDPAEDTPIEIDRRPGALTFVTTESRADGNIDPDSVRLSFEIPELTRADRLGLWRSLTRAPLPALVEGWTLTPAEVVAAAAAAPGGSAAVRRQLRRRLRARSSVLLTPVQCPYDWEDLIVAERVMGQLRDLESQIRLAGEVLDDWGFSRLTPERRGTTALFAGPSGTGKTMAASVLARSLDLELYRVDLAEVVNKYIGETEKRLAQVFDECERSRVLVLFDEADALFGQRTRVRDAHDRFANIEIDYLLSRMDTFDGVAILATNRKSELDTAFVRRLRVIVDFLSPGPGERRRLWDVALPDARDSGEPVSAGLDREQLASTLDLSPAEIKAVALGAAFLARDAGELVGPDHVTVSARRELAKRGAVLRPRTQPPEPAAVPLNGANR